MCSSRLEPDNFSLPSVRAEFNQRFPVHDLLLHSSTGARHEQTMPPEWRGKDFSCGLWSGFFRVLLFIHDWHLHIMKAVVTSLKIWQTAGHLL